MLRYHSTACVGSAAYSATTSIGRLMSRDVSTSTVIVHHSSMNVFSVSPARTCFMTLPLAVRGSGSVRSSTSVGTLYDASVSAQNARTSSAVSVLRGGTTTTAFTT